MPTGLEVDKAVRRAVGLRNRLCAGGIGASEFEMNPESVETLHALCLLLDHDDVTPPDRLLHDCEAAFRFVESIEWANGRFGGRGDLLSRLAFLCWHRARCSNSPAGEWKWMATYTSTATTQRQMAEAVLATPIEQRMDRSGELHLEDREQLLALCGILRDLAEAEPARARDEAELFYQFLESPRRSIGVFDEHDYYLGELALIAGAACRVLARRSESRHWFDLAEASFVLPHNASAHIARLAYQRLALRLEERDFDSVLKLAPRWLECFTRLELREDSLKCRFLEAVALKETDHLQEAKSAFRQIKQDSKIQQLDRLAAIAGQNLFHIHAFLRETDEAIVEAGEAAEVLGRLNNRVNLAKLQLGVGYLLREQRRFGESIEAFRTAQRQFSEIKMHADVAATHLVLADLLLDADQPAQAEGEIRAALPVIDDLKLVPEGIAALSLLRDSLRRRQIDRHALRSLNGYFEERGS